MPLPPLRKPVLFDLPVCHTKRGPWYGVREAGMVSPAGIELCYWPRRSCSVETDKKDLWRQQRTNFPWHENIEAAGTYISFVVPCFNEEDNVSDTLYEIVKCMTHLGKTFEIIVIDDCSTDRTVEKVLGFIDANKDVPVRLR